MIRRHLAALDDSRFDIAIVGGGIHGAAIAFESARRGLRTALVEKNDFGSGSTGNSLRILHGGLRYLQSADLPRFRQSVNARKWYAQRFPELVKSLPCLMPLYGKGAKRPAVMRAALTANDLLSADRNRNLLDTVRLPSGQVLDREETRRQFPAVRSEGLTGGALWYDYQMVSSERILIELLRAAESNGAVVANYVEAKRFVSSGGRMQGIVCGDNISGREFCVHAPVIVNCAGPGCGALALQAGCVQADFAPPSVAFNVLFESEPMGTCAMAVAGPEANAPMLFVCPSRHGLWAGTAHVARQRTAEYPVEPTPSEVEQFVAALHRAVPAFAWSRSRVRHVCWGVLPVTRENSIDLTVRPEIAVHEAGVQGLYSVVGIKYTTAGQVAMQALDVIFGSRLPVARDEHSGAAALHLANDTATLIDGDAAASLPRQDLLRIIEQTVREEAVFQPDDLLLRRTNWLFTCGDLQSLRDTVAQVLQKVHSAAPSSAQRSQLA